jgi:hypothetical protein
MDKYERYNAGPLKNFRKTDVVHKAITDYDRKRFKDYRNQVAKDLVIGGGTLLVGAASIHPIGRTVVGAYKGIKKAVKLAGSIGNTKKADTVGNRLKQAQAIMGKKGSELDRLSRNTYTTGKTSMFNQRYALQANKQPVKLAPDFGNRKIDRTLIRAVEQGPSKFFSKGRSAKTGVAVGKRDSGRISERAFNRDRQIAGVRDKLSLSPGDKLQVKRIEKESLFANKEILKQTLLSNKKAREALKKK